MTSVQFIHIWNSSLSIRQVRDRTGMNSNDANRRARMLRAEGFHLQRFDHNAVGLPASSHEGYEPRSPAKEPTIFRPGSLEKVEIMKRRVERQEHLWHPDDAKYPISSLEKYNEQKSRR